MKSWMLSGPALILVILAVRWAAGDRISRRARYALWLPVLLRLLVPVDLFQVRIYRQATASPVLPVVGGWETGEAMASAAASRLGWGDIAQVLWLVGTAAMSAVFLWSSIRFQRKVRKDRVLLEYAISPVPVYLTAQVEAPCLAGVFFPAVYVTEEVVRDGMLDHVLAHELTHLRHFDHVFSVLRCLALSIHWFDPLVWLAVKLSKEDAELACDEGTLCLLDRSQRAAYGETLIRLSCNSKGVSFMSTRMSSNKKNLQKRIEAIARRSKRSVSWLLAVVLVAVLATGCSFTQTTTVTTTAPPENIQAEPEETAPGSYHVVEEYLATILSVEEEALLAKLPYDDGNAFEENIRRDIWHMEANPSIEDAKLDAVELVQESDAEGVKIYGIQYAVKRTDGVEEIRSAYIIYKSEHQWCWTNDPNSTKTSFYNTSAGLE